MGDERRETDGSTDRPVRDSSGGQVGELPSHLHRRARSGPRSMVRGFHYSQGRVPPWCNLLLAVFIGGLGVVGMPSSRVEWVGVGGVASAAAIAIAVAIFIARVLHSWRE